MTKVLSIDPGLSSGLALGLVESGKPYRLIDRWQVEGGVAGLVGWFREYAGHPECCSGNLVVDVSSLNLDNGSYVDVDHVVCEKFVPLQGKGFAQTLGSTEPLRCEGALIAMDVMPDYPDPTWRRPNEMYVFGGKDLKEKKARGRQFLKDNGMYVTGKMVGCGDADDARSAIWHGLSYASKILRSKETFQQIADWTRQEGGK